MAVTPRAVDEVLVLRALGVGDLLTAVPALRAMRRRVVPRGRLLLAAPSWLAPLVAESGLVDRQVPCRDLDDRPRCGAVDLAVNLHGKGPQSVRLLRDLHPRELWSHRCTRPRVDGPRWRDDLHETDRWCALLHWHGVPSDPTDLLLTAPPGHVRQPGLVLVHPGASSGARRWPTPRFASVIRAVAARRPDARFVLTGTVGERRLARQVARSAGVDRVEIRAGSTDVAELAHLTAAAALVISGDTGIMHLATAYRTPSVTVFGPTPPSRWGPRIDADLHRVLYHGVPGDPHGNRPGPGLLSVEPAEVIAAAMHLLAAAPPAVRHG